MQFAAAAIMTMIELSVLVAFLAALNVWAGFFAGL